MKKLGVAAFGLALVYSLASGAADRNAPAASGQSGGSEVEMDKSMKIESPKTMNMNEPMPTGMARKGMKKGDVKAHAAKKEAVMDRMMKQEEQRQ